VAVGAENARAVGVVEQHELIDHLVLVYRNIGAENAKVGIAASFLMRPENLVVSAVLLDHVDHMFDGARLADALGNRPRRLIFTGRQGGLGNTAAAHVFGRAFRQLGEFRRAWQGK